MREWLREERFKHGLTQAELANNIGVASTTYAMIEQGNRNPSVGVAKKIAKELNFNWTIFFDEQLYEMCNQQSVR